MSIRKCKPTSPGRRHRSLLIRTGLSKECFKPLTESLPYKAGRNSSGRITVRHRGGRFHKRKYRIIDFKRNKDNIPALVERIEYDPNRNCHIALLLYADGERRYIICPEDVKTDDSIMSGSDAPIKSGNALTLSDIPVGSFIHCIELYPGCGGQIIRSAGTYAQYIARDGSYATIRLSSKEVRKVLLTCRATIGVVGNSGGRTNIGKAGANRWRGIRPTVRGVAMNPVDHPHGGGEGKTSGGRHPVSPWGTPTKGYKTRSSKKNSRLIVKRRNRKGR